MPRPTYAPTSRYRDGSQSRFDGGLTWYPDYGTVPFPLGNYADDAAALAGGAVAGPAGAVAGSFVSSELQKWFGGSAVDAARLARVNYVAGYAANGNVAAAQLILGAIPNVSGNERGMWETARDALDRTAPDVMTEARAEGPIQLLNNGDTAQNYPGMRRVIATWEAQHPLTSAIGAGSAAIAAHPAGVSLGLVAVAGLAALLLMKRR